MLLQNYISIAQAWHKVYVEKLSTEELEKEVERLKELNDSPTNLKD
jgi:DnaJ-domain-containing protein 1